MKDRNPCQKCHEIPLIDEPDGFVYLLWSGPYSGGIKYEFPMCQNCSFEMGKKIWDAVEPLVNGLWRTMVSGGMELTATIPGDKKLDGFIEALLPRGEK